MEYVTRLASEDVAPRYPLEIDGRADWHTVAGKRSTWMQEIRLPDIPEDHIVVPSFAQYDRLGQYSFHFRLHTTSDIFHLQPVPMPASVPAPDSKKPDKQATKASKDPDVSCHIDCWHTHTSLPSTLIRLEVNCARKPDRYLLTVSVRALAKLAVDDAAPMDIHASAGINISQMQAAGNIKARICSPTALTMALSVLDNAPDWQTTVEACYDPLTKAYGSWPLAIKWASQHDILGAVEVLHSWQDAGKILATGTPMVCSIRYGTGKLLGAPLTQTGGHLVMLHAVADNHVLVKDPAAANDPEVDRRYRVDEFGDAWLGWRGAAYIFCRD